MARLDHSVLYRFDLTEGPAFLKVALLNGGSVDKPFLAVVRLFDGDGILLTDPISGLGWSTVGAYKYLSGGSHSSPQVTIVRFIAPASARTAEIEISNWRHDEPPILQAAPESGGTLQARDAVRAPKKTDAREATPFVPEILLFQQIVEPGDTYVAKAVFTSGSAPNPKSNLIVLRSYSQDGSLVDWAPRGFGKSDRVGVFAYSGTADQDADIHFSVKISPPESVARFELSQRAWETKELLTVREIAVEARANLANQIKSIRASINRLCADVSQTSEHIVVITATTKVIDSENRLNRPQIMANELVNLGFRVIYVYYRFDPTEIVPKNENSNLVQIPIDIFALIFNEIAAGSPACNRTAIFSMPDDVSVRAAGLFRHNGWNTIYEVRDDWEEFAAAGVGKWYRAAFERFLASSCDRVVCVSEALGRKMRHFGAVADKVHIVPNATTQAFLDVAKPFRAGRSSGRRPVDSPILGYFGHLTEAWFDWGLIINSARARPDWTFDLIGFGAPDTIELPGNVMIRPAVPQLELPELTKAWHIATIPFKENPLSRAVNPIKVYDYIALGLPVLSVEMGSLSDMTGVYIYSGMKHFLNCADDLLNNIRFGGLEIESAIEHTWPARVRQMFSPATISGSN